MSTADIKASLMGDKSQLWNSFYDCEGNGKVKLAAKSLVVIPAFVILKAIDGVRNLFAGETITKLAQKLVAAKTKVLLEKTDYAEGSYQKTLKAFVKAVTDRAGGSPESRVLYLNAAKEIAKTASTGSLLKNESWIESHPTEGPKVLEEISDEFYAQQVKEFAQSQKLHMTPAALDGFQSQMEKLGVAKTTEEIQNDIYQLTLKNALVGSSKKEVEKQIDKKIAEMRDSKTLANEQKQLRKDLDAKLKKLNDDIKQYDGQHYNDDAGRIRAAHHKRKDLEKKYDEIRRNVPSDVQKIFDKPEKDMTMLSELDAYITKHPECKKQIEELLAAKKVKKAAFKEYEKLEQERDDLKTKRSKVEASLQDEAKLRERAQKAIDERIAVLENIRRGKLFERTKEDRLTELKKERDVLTAALFACRDDSLSPDQKDTYLRALPCRDALYKAVYEYDQSKNGPHKYVPGDHTFGETHASEPEYVSVFGAALAGRLEDVKREIKRLS
jgi:chromosome segregation ATPase